MLFLSALWTSEHGRERLQTSRFLGIKFWIIYGENVDMYQKHIEVSKHIEIKMYVLI